MHTFRFEESGVREGGTTFMHEEEFGGVLFCGYESLVGGRVCEEYVCGV